jgi:uncharacterized membrane protein HdeD (DUF308 family)
LREGIFDMAFLNHRDTETTPSKGARIFSVIAGALAVALSIMILASPAFGVQLAAVVIGIGLAVYGIRLVPIGIGSNSQDWEHNFISVMSYSKPKISIWKEGEDDLGT